VSIKKRIKKSLFYTIFIKYFFYPVYSIIWEYLINFKAKLLYILWKLKHGNKDYFNLDNNDKLLIKDDKILQNLSLKIFQESIKHVESTKTTLLSEDHKKKMIARFGEKSTDAIMPYRTSLFEKVDKKLQKEIVEFASSKKMISTAANYMKVFPILTRVQLSLNVPRDNSNLRGAMFWHKDTFGFRNLDFFMFISNVDDESAPFYFLKKKIQASTFMDFENLRPGNIPGERGKIALEEFSKFFSDEETEKMVGNSGTAVFVDSFSTFHRGGFCKSKDRIVLRLCYQSHDAFYEDHVFNDEEYMYDKDISIFNTNNIFYKYFFFKRKSKFMKFLSAFLLKLYRRIGFIVT